MKYLISLFLLTACTTPMTTLKKNDHVVICGGHVAASAMGGVIGYHLQKDADTQCIERLKQQGYKVQ